MKRGAANPWYREPWPWILMAGPAAVVVAGAVTVTLAVRTNDGLVADDYYKQGLAINRVLAREQRARTLGIDATLQFNDTRDHVRVTLRGAQAAAGPRLTFLHATRAGMDRAVRLQEVAPGVYDGVFGPTARGTWRIHLEDAQGSWRLDGEWHGGDGPVRLAPATP